MDHFNSLINWHLIGFALHRHDGGHPLPQALGSLAPWIKLFGTPAHAETLHDMGNLGIAGSASKPQVKRCHVGFIAVDVGDHQSLSRTTPQAVLPGWSALVGSLPEPPIRNLMGFLMPALPAGWP